jgi:hypothetical protein
MVSGVATFVLNDEQTDKNFSCDLFICGLFNDALSNSGYIPVNGRMIINES